MKNKLLYLILLIITTEIVAMNNYTKIELKPIKTKFDLSNSYLKWFLVSRKVILIFSNKK
jgi:hypothetical protein